MKKSSPAFSDLLAYAHLIDDGVMLNKDGAFLVSYQFQGPDLHSASSGEWDALTQAFNRMATLLDDGWMLHIDELRMPSIAYPENGSFPDVVSKMIDDERRQHYEAQGEHYENLQVLTFVWKFPQALLKNNRRWFVDEEIKNDEPDLNHLLIAFKENIERCLGLIKPHFSLKKLHSRDLLSYLNTCINGELLPIAKPPDGCFVDVALARHPVMGGYLPRVGNKWVGVLSIIGYVHEEIIPGLLAAMGTYPCIYRWSNRFIALGITTAACEIKRIQKQWHNQVKGLSGIIREVIFNQATQKINHDALDMHQQTDSALMQNSNQSTRFGYWTSTIVIMTEDKTILEQTLHDLSCYAEQSGFACLKEDLNAFDAWIGTIPGHGSCNARRLFISSNNLAHLLPLNSVWTGKALSSNHSLLSAHAPPVFYASTTGQTPFRFHLDVGDVGHQMVIGPTGAGKSTYLDLLIAQFLRYGGAQIFLFDKDYSHQALTKALGGKHYNLGQTKKLAFCPLADLSSASKKMRAQEWVENLIVLQNMVLTPEVISSIHQALESLSANEQRQYRNLTVLQALVQNESVRSALQYYTVQGAAGFLDGTSDLLQNNYLQTFEMKDLIVQKPQVYVPVLQYLFNQIENALEERPSYAPTLIILEEAWAYVSHPLFSHKLRDWLKTLRKKNARVVFATQSLTDLYDPTTQSLTAITAAVIESCLTKVYLPHAHMDSEIHTLYQKMGLSHRQIEIIQKEGLPKRQYYVVTPEGDRLIDLELHALALNFLGLSRKKSSDLLQCHAAHGEHWLAQWLSQNKLNLISQE